MAIINLNKNNLDDLYTFTCFGRSYNRKTICDRCNDIRLCGYYVKLLKVISRTNNVGKLAEYLASDIEFIREAAQRRYDWLESINGKVY